MDSVHLQQLFLQQQFCHIFILNLSLWENKRTAQILYFQNCNPSHQTSYQTHIPFFNQSTTNPNSFQNTPKGISHHK